MSRRRWKRISGLLAALVLSLSPGVDADAIYSVVDLGETSLAHLNAAGQVAWTVAPFNGGPTARSFLYSGYGPEAGRVVVIPGSSTTVGGINGSGQLIGTALGGPSTRDFVYDGGQVRDLGTLGGRRTNAAGINAAGQVAGTSETADGSEHAFLYSGGQLHDLGTLGGRRSDARALNDRGQVVGASETAAGEVHAFLYSGGRMHDLGTLGGSYGSYPTALNALGQVVGLSQTSSGEFHTFLYSGGRMHDLGVPAGAIDSSPVAINAAGQVLVQASGRSGSDWFSFGSLYSDGQFHDLTLGARAGYASALNAQGQVVGQVQVADGSLHAFVFRDGEVHDLNELIPPDTGWTLTGAIDLNDAGQILALGTRPDGTSHTFLVTPASLPTPAAPIPEPTALALLGLASAAAAVRLGSRRLRRRG